MRGCLLVISRAESDLVVELRRKQIDTICTVSSLVGLDKYFFSFIVYQSIKPLENSVVGCGKSDQLTKKQGTKH